MPITREPIVWEQATMRMTEAVTSSGAEKPAAPPPIFVMRNLQSSSFPGLTRESTPERRNPADGVHPQPLCGFARITAQ